MMVISLSLLMDTLTDCDPKEWEAMLKKNGLSDVMLRDARYDCVVHLVTAAIGAEEFYSKSTNAVRSESLEFARELDSEIQQLFILFLSI
jgi:hypothetical protein